MFLRLKDCCFLFVAFLNAFIVKGDYECLCNYNVETKVYSAASKNASTLAYMYEFDCKATYMLNQTGDLLSIQINHKVGYVINGSGIKIQLCQGSPDPSDKVDIATIQTSTMPPVPSSPSPSTTVPATKPSTTLMPTTATTTQKTTSTTRPTTSTSTVVTTNTSPDTPKPSDPPTKTTPLLVKTTALLGNKVSTLSSRSVITATPSNSTSVYACFPGWVLYGESCYLFHLDARYTWEASEVFCRIHHADLVSIETGDEQTFIEAQLKKLIDPGQSFASVWTAGSDQEQEGQWLWNQLSANKDIVGYQNWAPGQPTDNVDDCLNIDGKLQYQWDDNWCDDEMYYICERSAHYHTDTAVNGPGVAPTVTQPPPAMMTTTLPVTMQPTTGSNTGTAVCFPGWVLFKDSCYLFHTDSRYLWDESKTFCNIHHATLVAIESTDEQRFLQQALSNISSLANYQTAVSSGFWTAGNDEDDEDRWVWINDFSGDKAVQGYENWSPGQPDDGHSDSGQDCLSLIGIRQFEWSDYNCDDQMFYICERSAHYHVDAANAIVG